MGSLGPLWGALSLSLSGEPGYIDSDAWQTGFLVGD